ncbi:hypothetical protein PsYK624_073260 [Phanerochaete sordida]|uniref:Uncharacterized protein n=1 Tax=Phanerochaete sordida TaxID=48140 RepID=A0A9P3G8F0_9APHY|nr:hypothetical protein PsYK624_073260 [Phanerochaete sordida]
MSPSPEDVCGSPDAAGSAMKNGPSEQQWLAGSGPRIGNGGRSDNCGFNNIVDNSNQGDCESSCTIASIPKETRQLYKKNAAEAFAPGNKFSTSANASPSRHSALVQHASPTIAHPMTRQASPRTPVRRPILRPATEPPSPTSPTLTTPPLSPSSSVSSQDSADESFSTFASGDRGRYVRPDSIFVSTPPSSPTKAKSVEVRMLAEDDANEDELALLAPMPTAAKDRANVVPVQVEEVPRTQAPSDAAHDALAEMFAIFKSGDPSRYGRAIEIGKEIRASQRPVRVGMVAVDPDEYEAKFSAGDAARALLYEEKEMVVEVTVETVVSYDAPAGGNFPQARAYAPPPSPSSSTSSFYVRDPTPFRLPAPPPPSRVSLASPARSFATDDCPNSLRSVRSWSTVHEFAAVAQGVVADSQARFRPLAESIDIRSRRGSDAEPVELEAVGSATAEAGLFKRPRRLRDVVRAMPLRLSSPWKGSVKQGIEKAKKWARVLGSRRPSLDDVAK